MVFFTCSACGTALKKNQVERHFGCSRHVSCVDCQKDFFGMEYKAHTKCISEEEKYNGPDWKAPSSRNKGERKQTAWVETVNSVLENGRNNMSTKQIALLNIITKHDNVPRKRAKFLNFVQNVAKNFDRFTVEAVWDLLEAEWKRQAEANKPPVQANGTANGDSKSTENGQNGVENGAGNGENGHEKGEDDDKKKSKKKSKNNKRKRNEDNEEEVEVKKKKKGKSGEESLEEPEQENSEVDVEEPDSTTEFRWGDIIREVLMAHDDKSISLKKLKKKVFAEYYARVADSKGVKTKEELSSQLNKKLKKKHFKVVGDIVTLTEVEVDE